METIYRNCSPKGVRFYYVYKALANPEHNGYIKPVSLKERLMHVREAERILGSEITWLCDTMENEVRHRLGNAQNSEFVIDREGKIAHMRVWSRPQELRRDLVELVGPIENPTRVGDLNLKTEPPPRVAASGIVERVSMPGRMIPLEIEPDTAGSKHPFYVKLRAEVIPSVLETGQGPRRGLGSTGYEAWSRRDGFWPAA